MEDKTETQKRKKERYEGIISGNGDGKKGKRFLRF